MHPSHNDSFSSKSYTCATFDTIVYILPDLVFFMRICGDYNRMIIPHCRIYHSTVTDHHNDRGEFKFRSTAFSCVRR